MRPARSEAVASKPESVSRADEVLLCADDEDCLGVLLYERLGDDSEPPEIPLFFPLDFILAPPTELPPFMAEAFELPKFKPELFNKFNTD